MSASKPMPISCSCSAVQNQHQECVRIPVVHVEKLGIMHALVGVFPPSVAVLLSYKNPRALQTFSWQAGCIVDIFRLMRFCQEISYSNLVRLVDRMWLHYTLLDKVRL